MQNRLLIISVIASLAIYITLGFFLKGIVLNWIVGPLWLFIVLYFLPTSVNSLRRKLR